MEYEYVEKSTSHSLNTNLKAKKDLDDIYVISTVYISEFSNLLRNDIKKIIQAAQKFQDIDTSMSK